MTPYEYAKMDEGLSEIRGAIHNEKILEMFRAVGHGWVKDDETAWCAAAMGYWLSRAGLPHTGRLDAQSYKDYGTEVSIEDARVGDIVVWRFGPPGSWRGHLAFFVKRVGNYIDALGGNQQDKVGVNRYPISSSTYQLLSIRRPAKVTESRELERPKRDVGDLLNFIGDLESNGDYDAIVYAVERFRYPERKITAMTIGQVLDWQDSIDKYQNSEAVGKYQILEDTLREIYPKAGLTRSHRFDKKTQDELAIYLLRRRGLDRYLNGSISAKRFANNLAMEWASLPVVSTVKRGTRTIHRGESYYGGIAGNKALARADQLLDIVEALSKAKPSPARAAAPARRTQPLGLTSLLRRIFRRFK